MEEQAHMTPSHTSKLGTVGRLTRPHGPPLRQAQRRGAHELTSHNDTREAGTDNSRTCPHTTPSHTSEPGTERNAQPRSRPEKLQPTPRD
jgi:hypothetical protein